MTQRLLDVSDQTMECTTGNTWIRTGCILSYNGSIKDICLNYLVLIINVTYCIGALWKHDRKLIAFGCLVGVTLFQWSLCLGLGCSGVSIIWCAICGWVMHHHRQQESILANDNRSSTTSSTLVLLGRSNEWAKRVILFNIIVILYYAVIMEAITTVAHICALILGALLHIGFVGGLEEPNHDETCVPLLQESTNIPQDQDTM